jgi:hypothetical protein
VPEKLTCYDCGGNGLDAGSLHEPEACKVCLGAGELFVEFDPRNPARGVKNAFCSFLVRRGNALLVGTQCQLFPM